MKKVYNGPKDVLSVGLNIVLCMLLAAGMFILNNIEEIYGDVYLEQIIINLTQSVGGVDYNIVYAMVAAYVKNLFMVIVPYFVLSALFRVIWKKGALVKRQVVFTLFGIVGVGYLASLVDTEYKVVEYFTRTDEPTEIFEQYYADPQLTEMKFPEEERNLIYIFSESLETSILSEEAGGYEKESLLPNLEGMWKDNIVLSNGNGMQGHEPICGTTWTAAGIMSQTSGVPLKAALGGEDAYGSDGVYAPGVYNIAEVLADRGYKNYFRMGSEASYSNRDAYLKTNGNYEIYDLVHMKEIGVYPPDYKVGWGYEDYELFEFAKEDLMKISESGELFNYALLTVDTHFPNGHVCKYCPDEEERQYANVYKCQDKLISDFVAWIQEQDFYENTTIVIAGDHLSMDKNFFESYPEGAYRTPFNMIINSAVEMETTEGRYFTALDMYPTTLAAMGVEILGDRLGLGTNLLATRMTVLEELGFEELEKDLSGYSVYYNEKILQDPDIQYGE